MTATLITPNATVTADYATILALISNPERAKTELLAAVIAGADTEEDRTRLGTLLTKYGGLGKVMTENIEGTSFRIGDNVKVCGAADSTIDMRFVGREGIVQGFIFDDGAQFPNDLMVCVEFPSDGNRDGFWSEELDSIAPA